MAVIAPLLRALEVKQLDFFSPDERAILLHAERMAELGLGSGYLHVVLRYSHPELGDKLASIINGVSFRQVKTLDLGRLRDLLDPESVRTSPTFRSWRSAEATGTIIPTSPDLQYEFFTQPLLELAQTAGDWEKVFELRYGLALAYQRELLKEELALHQKSTGMDYHDRGAKKTPLAVKAQTNLKEFETTLNRLRQETSPELIAEKTRPATWKLSQAIGAFLTGKFDFLHRLLQSLKPEPFMDAEDLQLVLDLHRYVLLQKITEQAGPTYNIATVLLAIQINYLLGLFTDELPMTPAIAVYKEGTSVAAAKMELAYLELVEHVGTSIHENQAFSACIDWHNFFVYFERFVAERADQLGDKWTILANYWWLRYGKAYYSAVREKEPLSTQAYDDITLLIPQLKTLLRQNIITQAQFLDALDFQSRIEAQPHDPIPLAAPLAVFPRHDAKKKITNYPAINATTQEDISSVIDKLLRSAGMRARNPSTWLSSFKTSFLRWINPIRWPQLILHRAQDSLTATLSTEPDLLNAVMRFVDVLPEIEDDDQLVVSHFRQYFPQIDDRLPLLISWAVGLAHANLLPENIMAGLLRRAVRMMANRFIAGGDLSEARPKLAAMLKSGRGIIYDVMGEAITNETEANNYLEKYRQIIRDLIDDKKWLTLTRKMNRVKFSVPAFDPAYEVDAQMAIKLSGLLPRSQWNSADPEGTASRIKIKLRILLDDMIQADEQNGVRIRLTIDPEEYEFREVTLKVYKEILLEEKYLHLENVGKGVQTYHRDALAVLDDLAHWAQARAEQALAKGLSWPGRRGQSIPIRLVKGAYWDLENLLNQVHGLPLPVFTEQWMTNVNFERATDLLLANHKHLRAAIASHRARALGQAIEKARKLNVPMEVQMLYGMASDLEAALTSQGIPLWLYTPLGELLPSMAYLARRLIENASQGSFVNQRLLASDWKQLAQDPAEGHDTSQWPPVAGPPVTRASQPSQISSLSDPFKNEPVTDFSLEKNRRGLRAALDKITRQLSSDGPFVVHAIIDGQNLTARSRQQTVNPSNPGEIITTFGLNRAIEVDQAVTVAQRGLSIWRQGKSKGLAQDLGLVEYRARILLKAAQIMRAEKMDLIAIIMKESGKPVKSASADVDEAIDFLEYYAREAVRLVRDYPDRLLAPLGVAAIIPPWNFPLAIPTGMTTAALVTGNTVVLKPAEQTPLVAQRLVEILHRAGVPEDVLQFLPGNRETGKLLRAHEHVKLVAFTGSKTAGLSIYAEDVPRGVRVITEMGGKNAMIVGRDAHPDEVIQFVLEAKFGYAGQKCSALDRLIIVGEPERYDLITKRLVEAVRALRVGTVEDFGNFYGPVIDRTAYDRILQLTKALHSNRAVTVLTDQNIYSGHNGQAGYFIYPVIVGLDERNHHLPIMQEENFAPILGIIRAPDLARAVELAQDSEFGLTGAFISRSPEEIAEVTQLWQEVGNLYINRPQTSAVVGRNPFGGVKLSGNGGSKAGGREYLWQFIDVKNRAEETCDEIILSATRLFTRYAELATDYIVQPDEYQPDLPGETNLVWHRPMGSGWIVVDEDSNWDHVVGLASAAVHTGNHVTISLTSSMQHLFWHLFLATGRLEIRSKIDDGMVVKIMGQSKSVAVNLTPPPETEALKTRMASNPFVKWIAFGTPHKPDPVILRSAAQTPKGQSFVRTIITSDARTLDPTILMKMTEPRTVTVNTARHGFDAKTALARTSLLPGTRHNVLRRGFGRLR